MISPNGIFPEKPRSELCVTHICLCVCFDPVPVRGVELTQEAVSGGICATGISVGFGSKGRSFNRDLYMADLGRLPCAIANAC